MVCSALASRIDTQLLTIVFHNYGIQVVGYFGTACELADTPSEVFVAARASREQLRGLGQSLDPLLQLTNKNILSHNFI